MLKKCKLLLEKNKYIKQVVLFIYVNTYGKYKKNKENKNFLHNAKEVLEAVDGVFNALDIKYWLDFGTLLGAVRNADFLQHDDDLDFGVKLEDYTSEIEQIFVQHGFKKVIDFKIDDGNYGREETYIYLGVLVDIFYYTQSTQTQAYYHDFVPLPAKSRDKTIREVGGLIPRELTLALEGIEIIDFMGRQYPVPIPVDKHLADRYGEDFMLENKSWSFGKEVKPNIQILTNKIGVRMLYA